MYNCVKVIVNGRAVAFFADIDEAEMYRSLMRQQFAHLDLTIFCDWCYVDGLVF